MGINDLAQATMKTLALPILAAFSALSGCSAGPGLQAWSREAHGPLTGGGGSSRSAAKWGVAEYAWDKNAKRLNLTLEGHAWLSVFGEVDQWDAWIITPDEFQVVSKDLGAIRVRGIRSDKPETSLLLRLWKGANAPVLAATLRGFSHNMEVEIPQGGGRKPSVEEEAWLKKLILLGKAGRDADPPSTHDPQRDLTKGILYMTNYGLRNRFTERGEYPESGHENLVKALSEESKDRSKYSWPIEKVIKEGKILDAFGRPLVYLKVSLSEYRLYSLGEDGTDQEGAWDDVTSNP